MRLAVFVVLAIGTPARLAGADPSTDRVFTAPTAWLPPAGGLVATGTIDLRQVFAARLDSSVVVGYGLGGVAAVDLGTDTDVRACTNCGDTRALPIYLGRASFRLGAKQDAWFRGMPALVFGLRTSFAASGAFRDVTVSDAYVVGSRAVGPLRVHGGVELIDARFSDQGREVSLGPRPRPIGGLEWTPHQYPQTALMADIAFVPRLERTGVALEWVAGWGVRYQAYTWGAIDLAVRHRQGDELGDTTVMMRLTGVFAN